MIPRRLRIVNCNLKKKKKFFKFARRCGSRSVPHPCSFPSTSALEPIFTRKMLEGARYPSVGRDEGISFHLFFYLLILLYSYYFLINHGL